MIALDLLKIRAHLQSQGIESELQKETNQLCIIFKMGEREYPLFIRIYEGNELLQLLAFIPCNTKASTRADTARLLHLLNKEIDTPGFGMDENSDVVFFRTMIPVKENVVDESLINAYVQASQVVCQSFSAVIAAVAYGSVTFEEVMKKSKELSDESLTKSQLARNKNGA